MPHPRDYAKARLLIEFTRDGEDEPTTWQGRYDLECDTATLVEHIARCIEAQRLGCRYYLA